MNNSCSKLILVGVAIYVNFRGKVEGNTINGTWGVRGKRGEWAATRLGVPEQGEPQQ